MDKTKVKQMAYQLKTARVNKGFTQQELADATGISLRSIQRIENGEVYPRSFTLKALAEKLDVAFEAINAQKVAAKQPFKTGQLNGANTPQKVILSIVFAIVLGLLFCAFIFQSPRFPETAFEFVLLLAFVIGVYGFILFRIWR